MIPNNESLEEIKEDLVESFTVEEQPNYTYCINQEKKRTSGYCDNLQAMKQAVWKILNTERYEALIYSWEYGIELKDLIGEEFTYVNSEMKQRIEQALTQDDRVEEVDEFEIEKKGKKLLVTFTVHTKEGEFEEKMEVSL